MTNLLFTKNASFTKSDGSMVARIYERLTKASRRKQTTANFGYETTWVEKAYRQGVYDAFNALREEVKNI